MAVPCPCSGQSGHLLPASDGGQLTRAKALSSLPNPGGLPVSRSGGVGTGPYQLRGGMQKLEEELILPCRGPQAFLQAQRPLGKWGLVGIAGKWELESLERGAARAGRPDTWIMNLAESLEHRERKPSAFLWGPLWPKERSLWFLGM